MFCCHGWKGIGAPWHWEWGESGEKQGRWLPCWEYWAPQQLPRNICTCSPLCLFVSPAPARCVGATPWCLAHLGGGWGCSWVKSARLLFRLRTRILQLEAATIRVIATSRKPGPALTPIAWGLGGGRREPRAGN